MRTLTFVALASLAAAPLAAQTPSLTPPRTGPDVELIDRVVAVVGDTTLLYSDILGGLQELRASGRPVPEDPAQREALAREIMENRIADLVLVEAARDAGISVPDDEIRDRVEQQMREVQQRFGTERDLDAALAQSGLSRAQYRRNLEQRMRDQQLIESFLQARMRSRARPVISEEQIRGVFEERSATLGTRPANVSLQQVVIAPTPDDSARAQALRTAEEVREQLIQGGDFEVLAKRYSDDPGSKEHGGELGWFKQDGRMVREFEDMAFRLRPGQISPVVKTAFGYHIIKLDKIRGPERQARHILIRPELTDADQQRARQRADSVAAAVRGGANVLALAKQYDTPEAEVEVARIPISSLPPAYAAAVEGAANGSVIGPVEVEGPTGSTWAVIKLTDRQEAGPYSLDDVREQIVQRLQQQMMMEQLVAELRGQMYVQVLM